MPGYKYRKKRSFKKKSPKSKGRTAHMLRTPGSSLISATAGSSPYKPFLRVTQAYAEVYQISTGVFGVTGARQMMNLNSVADPDATGGGHRPYGSNEFGGAYGQYKVFGCTVRITVYTPTSSMWICVGVAAPRDGYNISALTPFYVAEKPGFAMKFIPAGSTGQTVVFQQHYVIADAMAISKADFKSEMADFSGGIWTSPPFVTQMQIAIANTDTSQANAQTASVLVELDYDVLWTLRNTRASS